MDVVRVNTSKLLLHTRPLKATGFQVRKRWADKPPRIINLTHQNHSRSNLIAWLFWLAICENCLRIVEPVRAAIRAPFSSTTLQAPAPLSHLERRVDLFASIKMLGATRAPALQGGNLYRKIGDGGGLADGCGRRVLKKPQIITCASPPAVAGSDRWSGERFESYSVSSPYWYLPADNGH